ncbi:hypothetical protein [Limnoglobus roseus]|uniref:Uncharacterized protein n=1 Tax=Limnoglobus roseus TaxID=2598579 RepID=A0A5C1AEY3_9BACT|nr:hypothetical protein [Limnoglobus roseus]QEL16272.1 hypothetical protein PX52LOC_03213 [Limnoglobus roseus]
MQLWRAKPNGDNPHWVCCVMTAVPVLLGVVMAFSWINPQRRSAPPAAKKTSPNAAPALTLAVRMP